MAITDLVDIVDENDQVIGTKTIQEVREKGYIHRIARIMVENQLGDKILLQKRTAKLLWPNCWDNSAAGHVDAGEDYTTAAKRELFEELGIKADSLEEVDTYFTDVVINGHRLKRFNRLYKLKYEDTPTNFGRDEVAGVKWLFIPEVEEFIKNYPDQVTDGLVDVMSRYY